MAMSWENRIKSLNELFDNYHNLRCNLFNLGFINSPNMTVEEQELAKIQIDKMKEISEKLEITLKDYFSKDIIKLKYIIQSLILEFGYGDGWSYEDFLDYVIEKFPDDLKLKIKR